MSDPVVSPPTPQEATDPRTVQARLDEADMWERRAISRLTDAALLEQQARQDLQKASDRRAEVNHCHHCGRPDEADGDHTCLCPNRDEDCDLHPIPRSALGGSR